MIEVELFDGTILEFPEGTSPDVIDRVAKQETQNRRQSTPDEKASTAAETAADVGKSLASGISRGVTGILDLPNMAFDLATRGTAAGLEATGLASPEFAEALRQQSARGISGAGTARQLAAEVTGGATEYEPQTTPGQYAGTVGEFLPGSVLAGPGGMGRALLQYGVLPGLASEAAGQATEGTALEPAARIAGAFFAPMAVSTANKTVNAMFNRASARPSYEAMKDAKNAAYRAVDQSGVTFPASVADDIAARAKQAAASRNFDPDVDRQTLAALRALDNKVGKQLTFGELDKVRRGLSNRYDASVQPGGKGGEIAILDMIDIIDDAMQNAPGGDELIKAARLANSRFKKSELLQNAFTKAEDQTAAAGTGGNLVNKYRQAVSSIINNPRQAKYFSKDELEFMRQFVRGSLPENTMRLIGKMSPTSNGLMMALNVGAAATNPAMLGASVAGAAAKTVADTSAMRGADAIQTMLATGQVPQAARTVTDPRMIGILPGLLSQE